MIPQQQNPGPIQAQVSNTTKIPRIVTQKGSESLSRKGELAPTEANMDLKYQEYLLKDLQPSDFQMETPLAAYFVLIFGSTVGFCVCFLICCRLRNQKRRGRKRNLASDAAGDGDYLVNGLYL